MVNAADIPPELFNDILDYVCEDMRNMAMLPHPSGVKPINIEKRKRIAACSPAFIGLVFVAEHSSAKTPGRLTSIAEFVWVATLAQRAEDRPWLHTLHMQPSLFPPMPGAIIEFFIVDAPGGSTTVSNHIQPSPLPRLFSGLPRTLPPSCYQCDYLTIQSPRFHHTNDIMTLIRKFVFRSIDIDGACRLTLIDVEWEPQIHFHSGLLGGVMLTPISHSTVVSVVGHWVDLVETGWLAYSIISHNMHLFLGPFPIPSSDNIVCLRVHSSVQTAIFSIMQFCCLTLDEASLSIHSPRMGTIEAVSARLQEICSISLDSLGEHKDGVHLAFYAKQSSAESAGGNGYMTIASVSALRVTVTGDYSQTHPGTVLPGQSYDIISYPLENIVSLLLGMEGFLRLQVELPTYEDLVRFMGERRAVLAKLGGDKVGLYNGTKGYAAPGTEIRAVDFESLKDIGDAWSHGYFSH